MFKFLMTDPKVLENKLEMPNLSRRGFMGLLGGAAAAAAVAPVIPFNRVWSFPSKIVLASPTHVRFIRMYDPYTARFINRFDVLYGWGTLNPDLTIKVEQSGGIYEAITVPKESLVEGAILDLRQRLKIAEDIPADLLSKQGDDPQIRGIDFLDDSLSNCAYGYMKGASAERYLKS